MTVATCHKNIYILFADEVMLAVCKVTSFNIRALGINCRATGQINGGKQRFYWPEMVINWSDHGMMNMRNATCVGAQILKVPTQVALPFGIDIH